MKEEEKVPKPVGRPSATPKRCSQCSQEGDLEKYADGKFYHKLCYVFASYEPQFIRKEVNLDIKKRIQCTFCGFFSGVKVIFYQNENQQTAHPYCLKGRNIKVESFELSNAFAYASQILLTLIKFDDKF